VLFSACGCAGRLAGCVATHATRFARGALVGAPPLIASPHAQRRRAPRRLHRRVRRAAGGDPAADPGAARGRARARGARPCGGLAGGAERVWQSGRASSAGRGCGRPRRGGRGGRGGRRCGPGAAGRRHARAVDAWGARRSAGAGGGRQRERPAPSRRAARSPRCRTSSRALSRAWRARTSARALSQYVRGLCSRPTAVLYSVQ